MYKSAIMAREFNLSGQFLEAKSRSWSNYIWMIHDRVKDRRREKPSFSRLLLLL
jgi:hypothetical protein